MTKAQHAILDELKSGAHLFRNATGQIKLSSTGKTVGDSTFTTLLAMGVIQSDGARRWVATR